MIGFTFKDCPQCGQHLRFPDHIGGILMACPSCGKIFYPDFKLGSIKNEKIIKITVPTIGKQFD